MTEGGARWPEELVRILKAWNDVPEGLERVPLAEAPDDAVRNRASLWLGRYKTGGAPKGGNKASKVEAAELIQSLVYQVDELEYRLRHALRERPTICDKIREIWEAIVR